MNDPQPFFCGLSLVLARIFLAKAINIVSGSSYYSETWCKASSRKRPPPVSDRLSKTPKVCQSKPYSWNL